MHSPADVVLGDPTVSSVKSSLNAKRVAMITFSPYPSDPRPRRAVEALIDAGMSVDLICLAEDQAPRREKQDALDVTRLPITHRRGGGLSYAYQYSALLSISASILAVRSLKRRYSIVYVHNMPDFLVFSALVPKLMGAGVILDMHDPMPELMTTIFNLHEDTVGVRVLRFVEKWSMGYANAVITVNAACKRIFAERSCPPEKIRVVMNSPDEEIFPLRSVSVHNAEGLGARRFVLLYHGSLVERNGLDLAVDAVSKIRQTIPGVELRICGRSTPFLERVLEEVRLKGLQDYVRYLGPKRLEVMVGEIEACDVGLIPNHRNAFTAINTPTRIFEYLALGKPVIAPRMPGILDYFSPEALLFFEAGDSDDLARAIEHVYHHPEHARAAVEQGQQIYLAHTWRRERETLVNTVSDVLAKAATA
jgi:glycosyltransferase involved in cell wall biosynthesis